MQTYEVTVAKGVKVPVGTRIGRLDQTQIDRRAHALEVEKDAKSPAMRVFVLKTATMFKLGETFGADLDMNKALSAQLSAPSKKGAAKKSAPPPQDETPAVEGDGGTPVDTETGGDAAGLNPEA